MTLQKFIFQCLDVKAGLLCLGASSDAARHLRFSHRSILFKWSLAIDLGRLASVFFEFAGLKRVRLIGLID